MAEKSLVNQPKDLVEVTPEELLKIEKAIPSLEAEDIPVTIVRKKPKEIEEEKRRKAIDSWVPKTNLGRLVKAGKIKDIDEVLTKHKKIIEPEIVDLLIKLESDLLEIGQAKGKFGGGKRRAWRSTQKKTMEGNVMSFSCMAVVGDKNGHVGIGVGKSKETLPSRDKALRNARLNLIKVIRGFETKEEMGAKQHTIPFVVDGKSGSVRVRLIPAPRGTGLVIGDECKKILRLAGIEDIYSMAKGQTRTTFNFASACIDALKKLGRMKQ